MMIFNANFPKNLTSCSSQGKLPVRNKAAYRYNHIQQKPQLLSCENFPLVALTHLLSKTFAKENHEIFKKNPVLPQEAPTNEFRLSAMSISS